MIKIENIEWWGFDHAIRGMRAKGYRKVKNGYEAFNSFHCKFISLGRYKSEDKAKEAVYTYRINRFLTACKELGLNAEDGVEYEKNYIVFPSGRILNLHGSEMVGGIGRDGYRHVILNGKNVDVHRVIAKVFVPNPKGLEQVNHIDGCKTNNDVRNLEWCTRSENLKHAYAHGLEKRNCGEKNQFHKLTNEDVLFIRENVKPYDSEFGYCALARRFGVDKSTVRAICKREAWKHI